MVKGKGADSSSLKLNLTDPCHTVPCQYHWGVRPAGWVNCFSICAGTMPRAQSRAAKISIKMQRRNTLPDLGIIYLWCYSSVILLYTIYFHVIA